MAEPAHDRGQRLRSHECSMAAPRPLMMSFFVMALLEGCGEPCPASGLGTEVVTQVGVLLFLLPQACAEWTKRR